MFCATTDGSSEELEESKTKDRLALDICVICLEQEYNAVFVP
jgi:E3 ubiquitin-protein ligase MUL1